MVEHNTVIGFLFCDKEITIVQKVEKSATKLEKVSIGYRKGYDKRLKGLGLTTLVQRRLVGDLIHTLIVMRITPVITAIFSC